MSNLVTDIVQVSRLIAAELWGANNVDSLKDIAKQLSFEMVEATRQAADGIPAALEGIVLRHVKHDNGDVEMIALWSPDPADGVALFGGPMDGALVALPRLADTHMPPDEFLGATLTGPEQEAIDKIETDGALYKRVGIDKHFDRWVYQYSQTN